LKVWNSQSKYNYLSRKWATCFG